jgi:hypothetical protein
MTSQFFYLARKIKGDALIFEYIPSFVIAPYAPMHEVVPNVVSRAVMTLATICKIVFQPSFFMILLDFNG